jgi:hypothetical protein
VTPDDDATVRRVDPAGLVFVLFAFLFYDPEQR